MIKDGMYEEGGTKTWYKNGVKHRENAPAYIGPIHKMWFYEGKLHREDGPAIVWIDRNGKPTGVHEYWYHGKYINTNSYEEFKRRIKLKVFW